MLDGPSQTHDKVTKTKKMNTENDFFLCVKRGTAI